LLTDAAMLEETWNWTGDQYSAAELRVMGVRHNGLRLAHGLLVFTAQKPKFRKSVILDEVEFHQQIVEVRDARRFLEQTRPSSWAPLTVLDKFAALTFEEGASPMNFPKAGWPIPLGKARRLFGWPERQFMVRCTSGGGFGGYLNGPFVGRGERPVASLMEFFEKNMGIPAPEFWANNPGIRAVFPDYRLAIASVKLESSLITIDLRAGSVRTTQVDVHAMALDGNRQGTTIDLKRRGKGWVGPLPAIPARVVVLVTEKSTGRVLDWADFDPLESGSDSAIRVNYGSHELLALISEGEGEALEFKSSASKSNRDDVLATLVGFANSKGGRMLIGVTDEGEVVGTDPATSRRIQNWAQDLVEPRLDVTTVPGQASGRAILTVRVNEGRFKPYFTRSGNSAYVRVGAADKRATRAELERLFKATPPPVLL
jgi:hypothetical protein